MAPSNSNNPHNKIYVSASPFNVYEDDQSLESPMITFKCNVKTYYISQEPDNINHYFLDHNSWHNFEHPANELTRDVISDILVNIVIPFSLRNLHWKYDIESSIPLMSTDDFITSVLDVCHRMITQESGRKKLFLHVFIRKEEIVTCDEHLAMLRAKQAQEILQQVEDMVMLDAQGFDFRQSDWEYMAESIRELGLGNSIGDALDLVMERARSESTEEAVVKLVPADAKSIQALEKVTYCNNNDFNSEEKCSVCMEEMVIGSQVTVMPCSHVYHGDCIVQWLKTSHMCPVCRFKLPTA
ncbi:hypothetical protein REPUB_Repub08aG0193600 [Reevesia pubescens]